MCKKLDLHISADSIVTPESVIYRPTIVMQADQPVRVREQTAEEESTDSIHIERQTYIDTDSTAAVRDTRETTAVAEPPSILSVYALLALLAVIAIMIKTIHSKKT
ncbi:MAG: hypothetical protein K2J06_03720 [Muribaculaceae bacterium]|nr:hypothetical protein [Muribaculaceae bacterium]